MIGLVLLILACASIANGCGNNKSETPPTSGYDFRPIEKAFEKCLLQQVQSEKGRGVSYIRWGRTKCPEDNQLVYSGMAAGSKYDQIGGGANLVCLVTASEGSSKVQYFKSNLAASNGEILRTTAYWYGSFAERSGPLVPCVACYSPRSAELMIPGTIDCPNGWTEEYDGYLVAGHNSYSNNVEFKCMDEDAEGIGKTSSPWPHGYLYTLGTAVNPGTTSPPFEPTKAITCVVCTK